MGLYPNFNSLFKTHLSNTNMATTLMLLLTTSASDMHAVPAFYSMTLCAHEVVVKPRTELICVGYKQNQLYL